MMNLRMCKTDIHLKFSCGNDHNAFFSNHLKIKLFQICFFFRRTSNVMLLPSLVLQLRTSQLKIEIVCCASLFLRINKFLLQPGRTFLYRVAIMIIFSVDDLDVSVCSCGWVRVKDD